MGGSGPVAKITAAPVEQKQITTMAHSPLLWNRECNSCIWTIINYLQGVHMCCILECSMHSAHLLFIPSHSERDWWPILLISSKST